MESDASTKSSCFVPPSKFFCSPHKFSSVGGRRCFNEVGTTLSMYRLSFFLIRQWPLWVSASFLLAMGCGQTDPAGGNASGTQTSTITSTASSTDSEVNDACATNNGGCDANASCTNAETPGDAPSCECRSGFTGDGQTCTATDISCAPTQVPHSS